MVNVLFEDDFILIVDKQVGIPVHKTLDPKRLSLEDQVKSYLKSSSGNPDPYLALHHRLDKDTSGAILFAKNKEINPVISNMFKNREITKIYLAVVDNKFTCDSSMEDYADIKKIDKIDRLVKLDKGGFKVRTEILENEYIVQKKISSLKLKLITGKMHQIRAQLSFRGHPIVGDSIYGGRPYQRLMLHSHLLNFIHPKTGNEISVKSMPSDDF